MQFLMFKNPTFNCCKQAIQVLTFDLVNVIKDLCQTKSIVFVKQIMIG